MGKEFLKALLTPNGVLCADNRSSSRAHQVITDDMKVHMQELRDQGLSIPVIASRVQVSEPTVKKYTHAAK